MATKRVDVSKTHTNALWLTMSIASCLILCKFKTVDYNSFDAPKPMNAIAYLIPLKTFSINFN